MGTVFPRQSDNMKLIAVLALAAVAFAEPEADPKADPWLTYGYAGYGLPYAGVYGGYRTYGAYPYSYGYYGKRSAEAEPEAEADPAVLYSTAHVAAPLTTAYTHAVAAPALTYPHAVAAPAVTYTAAVPAVATTAVNTVKAVVPAVTGGVYNGFPYYTYGKRSADAEADPALLYTAGVAPLAYTHHAVAAPAVAAYTVPAVATVAKAPAHGVAATYAGLVHSSHVGVCLNNVGVQVPC